MKLTKTVVEKLKPHTEVELKIIEGASHFFEGHLDELKQTITEWAHRHATSSKSA